MAGDRTTRLLRGPLRGTVWLFGRELLSFDIDLTEITPGEAADCNEAATPPPDEAAEEPPAADPSTYTAEASSPRLAATSLTPDPDPMDRHGFGFAAPIHRSNP